MTQEDPKKKPIDMLFALEEQRLRRRREALDRKFQTTIQHIDEVAKANEECYKAKKAIAETAKGNPPPIPPPPPVGAPLQAPLSAPPPAPPSPLSATMLRSPWPRGTPMLRPLVRPQTPPPTIPVSKSKPKSKRKKK
jgi:hypothetical protein